MSVSGAGFLTIGVPAAVAIRLATVECTLLLVRRARAARVLALAGSGSLHAYLAYVLVPGMLQLTRLGGSK